VSRAGVVTIQAGGWASLNGCDDVSTTVNDEAVAVVNGLNVTTYYNMTTWSGCTDDVEVKLLTIVGGNHGPFFPFVPIKTTDMVWEFISQFSLDGRIVVDEPEPETSAATGAGSSMTMVLMLLIGGTLSLM
jgi:poly(3-hydroxybutyrate) depolymerase